VRKLKKKWRDSVDDDSDVVNDAGVDAGVNGGVDAEGTWAGCRVTGVLTFLGYNTPELLRPFGPLRELKSRSPVHWCTSACTEMSGSYVRWL